MIRSLPTAVRNEPWALALPALLALVFVVYAPGLGGGFLFDDFINLNRLGELGGVNDWNSAFEYLFGGNSAVAGRPLSLASFLIDDNNWPTEPYRFKYTNLLLHLLITTIVFAFSVQLARALGIKTNAQAMVAVLAAAIWALHPFFVSTVLYVVQRMAMLSTLFVFAGLTVYVLGRRRLAAGRVPSGYLWMSVALAVFTPLAFLSKQNGALLPVLVLVLEFALLGAFLATDPERWRYRLWRAVFLYLPVLLMVGYFAINWNDTITAGYVREGLTLKGRLLTEARIIFDYLGHLLVPKIQTTGLLHDDYPMSRSLFSPPTTFFALLGIVALLALAFAVRARHPLIACAILFFFAGHLIESTFIPLEVYFEHRNYLPTLVLAFAAAVGITRIPTRYAAPAALAIVTLLGAFTAARADLWSRPDELVLTWAEQAPESARAHQYSALIYMNRGLPDHARESLEEGLEHHPNHPVMNVQYLIALCATDRYSDEALEKIVPRLRDRPLSNYFTRNIEVLVTRAIYGQCGTFDAPSALSLIDSLIDQDFMSAFPGAIEDLNFQKGRILLALERPDEARDAFVTSASATRSLPAAMRTAGLLASTGNYEQALDLLDLAERFHASQNIEVVNVRRQLQAISIDYAAEIERIRKQIRREMQARSSESRSRSRLVIPGPPGTAGLAEAGVAAPAIDPLAGGAMSSLQVPRYT